MAGGDGADVDLRARAGLALPGAERPPPLAGADGGAPLILALAAAASIWGAVTGFYGTRDWRPLDVCQARYRADRFALVEASIHGRRHITALHLLNARTGWVVMWADGKVNRKIGPSTRPLVLAEVTRLKAQCLAP